MDEVTQIAPKKNHHFGLIFLGLAYIAIGCGIRGFTSLLGMTPQNLYISENSPVIAYGIYTTIPFLIMTAMMCINGVLMIERKDEPAADDYLYMNDLLILGAGIIGLILFLSLGLVLIALIYLALALILFLFHRRSVKKAHPEGLVFRFGWSNIMSLGIAVAIAMFPLISDGIKAKAAVSGKLEELKVQKDFTEFTMKDFEGNKVTEEILAGHKVTLVNVWATYCGPCVQEMPALEELGQGYAPEDLQILGICGDLWTQKGVSAEQLAKAKKIVELTGVTYRNLIPSIGAMQGIISKLYGFPTTFFLNEKGEALGVLFGARDKTTFEKLINGYLEGMEE